MKKYLVLLLCALLLTTAAATAEAAAPSTIPLDSGEVLRYDFGENRLHAYVSGDALGDTCYAVETADAIVLMESTAFNEAFPDFAGANDLEMIAGFLFPAA